MIQFDKICFWSDSEPHFCSAELMYFIFNYLLLIYNKKFFLNYFVEYHGKNIVDNHFGILSRWFKEGESIQYIYIIEELINYFKNKTQNYNNYSFEIYSRTKSKKFINKLLINNFCLYLSFTKFNDKLYISTLSTFNINDYKEISFKIKKIQDTRKTKYTISKEKTNDTSPIMGDRNKQRLLIRIENTPNYPIPMEF